MKTQARLKLLTITLVALSLILHQIIRISGNSFTFKAPIIQDQSVEISRVNLPVRLNIPSINVSTLIEPVGLTSRREMDLPKNALSVGWYDLGPRPGEKGSAVIAGHFNTENGDAGVFFNLYRLKKGDRISVKNDGGTDIIFVVQRSELFDSGLAGEVFSLSDGVAHLNLITCDGVWDGVKKNYTKRLVVFADLEK